MDLLRGSRGRSIVLTFWIDVGIDGCDIGTRSYIYIYSPHVNNHGHKLWLGLRGQQLNEGFSGLTQFDCEILRIMDILFRRFSTGTAEMEGNIVGVLKIYCYFYLSIL